ncbi:MAG: hypothetical protein H6713_24145 [Myxococcales bacterium]|nr:hypothetical protein [Myxococcales bacterium]
MLPGVRGGSQRPRARARDLWRRRGVLIARLRGAAGDGRVDPPHARFFTRVADEPRRCRRPRSSARARATQRLPLSGRASPTLGELLGAARLLVGNPSREFAGVIPAAAFPPGGLYLPHLQVMLHGRGGPVAVTPLGGAARFVWTDGHAVTLPYGLEAAHREGLAVAGRVHAVPVVRGWPLLGALDELADVDHRLREHPTADRRALAEGIDLLEETWPVALAACRRIYAGALLLEHTPACVRSHTANDRLPILCASARDPAQVAEALAHEGAHARLAPFLEFDPLLRDDGDAAHPSPWREDPRPLMGVLQGVHAFVNVCWLLRALLERDAARFAGLAPVLERQRGKTRAAWAYLEPRARPTALGERFLGDLARAVAQL